MGECAVKFLVVRVVVTVWARNDESGSRSVGKSIFVAARCELGTCMYSTMRMFVSDNVSEHV